MNAPAEVSRVELIEAGNNLRLWMDAVIEWRNGDYRIHDGEENRAWLLGSPSVPNAINGFKGSEHEARQELERQRCFAIARWDEAVRVAEGGAK